MRNKYLLSNLLLLLTFTLTAQTWEAPEDQKAKLCTFEFSSQNHSAGNDLYTKNCKSCHGDPGKNNAVKLVPPPPDPAALQMQQNTDGSLHYKVYEGKGTMPSFKNTLSSSDIWNIVSFIRTFNPSYKQQIAVKPKFDGSIPDKINLKIEWNKEKQKIEVVISGLKDQVVKPLPGIEIKLFAKRYFGNLAIDKPQESDVNGKVLFAIPKNLPGDSAGVIIFIAKVTNEDLLGTVSSEANLQIGIPNDRPPLNKERAIWNVGSKTPLWLLFSYLIVVLSVWGFIFYVMILLKKIFFLGKIKNRDK